MVSSTLFVVGTVTAFAGYFAGNWFLDREGVGLALSDEGVLRALFGSGLYMAGLGLFAAALGLLVRHTAAVLSDRARPGLRRGPDGLAAARDAGASGSPR